MGIVHALGRELDIAPGRPLDLEPDEIVEILAGAFRALDASPMDRPGTVRSGHPDVLLEVAKGDYPRALRRRPTAEPWEHSVMVDAMLWLNWLEGRDWRIVVARASGLSWPMIAARAGRTERLRAKGQAGPRTLRMLDDDVMAAAQALPRRTGLEHLPEHLQRWAVRLAVHREQGTWLDEWGPPPGKPGCEVPGWLMQRAG